MEKDIHVFICEDNELTKKLIKENFNKGQLTAAFSFKESEREAIVSALDGVVKEINHQ